MKEMTQEKFESLAPRQRGYVVYMAGSRVDQPYVLDEMDPYPNGSKESKQWNDGQQIAVQEVAESG